MVTFPTLPKIPEPIPIQGPRPDKRPYEVRLTDPLSEVTRKERRALLAVCVGSVEVVSVGLVPERISALGIDFGTVDQQAFLVIMGFVLVYFLITFGVYGYGDYLRRHHDQQDANQQWNAYQSASDDVSDVKASSPTGMASRSMTRVQTTSVSTARDLLDFVFPMILAVYAIFITFAAASYQVPLFAPQPEPPKIVNPAPVS